MWPRLRVVVISLYWFSTINLSHRDKWKTDFHSYHIYVLSDFKMCSMIWKIRLWQKLRNKICVKISLVEIKPWSSSLLLVLINRNMQYVFFGINLISSKKVGFTNIDTDTFSKFDVLSNLWLSWVYVAFSINYFCEI